MSRNRLSDIKTGYVRFVRGTPTAWEALTEKSNDTLYFISEKDAPSGLLYLGSKLISGGGDITINQGGSTIKKLSKLEDVKLDVEISDGSVLTYDAKTKKWINKKIETGSGGNTTIIQKVEAELMVGATEYSAGKPGYVPKPYAEDSRLYLKGDGTWSNPTEALEVELFSLRQGDEGSIREIAASEIVKIFGKNVPENYNTIEKIANWIVNNGSSVGSTEGIERLDALEKAVYGADKTSSTDGLVAVSKQLVNTIYGNDSEGVEGLTTVCTRLNGDNLQFRSDIAILQQDYKRLNTTVTDLDGRLTWKKY